MKARARKWLRYLSRFFVPLALLAIFLTSFVLGVLLHLPLPPSRRLATHLAMVQVSRAIQGSIEIEKISRLHFRGVEAEGVTIRDPEGEIVLQAPVLRARANLVTIGLSFLPWSKKGHVRISWVHADHIDVIFREDFDGNLTLETTFLPPVKEEPEPVTPEVPSFPVLVDLEHVAIGSVQAKGSLGGMTDVDWRARTVRGVVHVAPDAVRIDTATFPLAFHNLLPNPVRTTVDYHFRSPDLMWSTVLATYQDLAVSGRVQLKEDVLLIDLDLPRTEGSALAFFLPEGVVLEDAIEGKIKAHGTLPVLDTSIRLTADRTLIRGKGKVVLAPRFHTDIDMDVRRLDLSRIVVGAPVSAIDADLRVRARLDQDGSPRVRLTGDISPTTLFDVPLPGADVDALVDSKGVSGLAHIHEFGMPVRADFIVSNTGVVRVTAVTNIPSLASVPRLQRAVSGYAVVKLEGTYDDGQFDANVALNGGNLAREDVRIGAADVDLHLFGTAENLRMDASVRGGRVDLGGVRWHSLVASLRGPVRTPHLHLTLRDDTMPHVKLEAGLDVRQHFAARTVDLRLERGGEVLEARSDLVEVRGGMLDLGVLAIDGIGEPIDAIARVGSTGFDVRVVSDGIDLDRLSNLLSLPGPWMRGVVELDVDLRNSGNDTSGCIKIDIQDGTVYMVPPLTDIDLSIRALFNDRHVDLDTAVSWGGRKKSKDKRLSGVCLPARSVREEALLQAHATATLSLAGPPMDPTSWERSTGTARLVNLGLDLNRVNERLKLLAVAGRFLDMDNVPSLGGHIQVNADIVRNRPDAPPSWNLSARTTALSVGLPGEGFFRSIDNTDLAASISLSQEGQLRTTMCVHGLDQALDPNPCDPQKESVLAILGVLAEIDYQQLFEAPSTWEEVLSEARVDGRLVLQDRKLESFLEPFDKEITNLPVEVDRLTATLGVRGTLFTPQFDYRVNLVGLGSTDADWRAPISVCGQGQYDGRRAWLHTELRQVTEGEISASDLCGLSPGSRVRSLGTVDGDLLVAWNDILGASSLSSIPWVANLEALIHSFDLASVPALADNGFSGTTRLAGSIKGLGVEPKVDIQMMVESLRTGPTIKYDQSHVRIHSDASGLQGSLAFIDVDENGETTSSLTLRVDTKQVQWEDGWVPTRDGSQPVDIAIESKRFKLGMVTPLVQPLFSYVDGELTGKAEGTWNPSEGKSRIGSMSFWVENGAFQVPAIGQEFLDVKGMLQAADSERIFVERFEAQSLTGAMEGRATIDLDDLDIKLVQASMRTKQNDKIRLTFGGMPVGDFQGIVIATIEPGTDQHDVKVVFENVRVDLPRTDMRSVQQLDLNPEISIYPDVDAMGVRKTGKAEVTPWVVAFETKNPAVLQRFDMNFRIVTSPATPLVLVYPDPETGEAKLEGHILFFDGRVDVVGNRFEIEENTSRIIFDGNPGDPALNMTAQWDAQDGTRVFADVTGPLRDPRIQFRSEPAMPQAEILALILFGPQTEGVSGTTTAAEGEGSAATDMGGGVAAAGINMLLQDLTPGVSTRIDTSRGQSASPTLVVQVSQNVTAEATYVPEDVTLDKADRYLVAVDWRFRRKWSLRITRGNVGTSILDVIWQHRY